MFAETQSPAGALSEGTFTVTLPEAKEAETPPVFASVRSDSLATGRTGSPSGFTVLEVALGVGSGSALPSDWAGPAVLGVGSGATGACDGSEGTGGFSEVGSCGGV